MYSGQGKSALQSIQLHLVNVGQYFEVFLLIDTALHITTDPGSIAVEDICHWQPAVQRGAAQKQEEKEEEG